MPFFNPRPFQFDQFGRPINANATPGIQGIQSFRKQNEVNPLNPPPSSTPTSNLSSFSPDITNNIPTGLAGLRGRKTPEIDAYREYLKSQPKREDYQLNKVGKILAGVAGVADSYNRGAGEGIKTGYGILGRPYQQAIEDYSVRGGRLKELADLEYRGLTDEQKLEVQIAEDALKTRKQMMDDLKTYSGINLDNAQAANLQDQMKARGWTNPTKDEITGQMVSVNTKTGEKREFGKLYQTIQEQNKEWDRRYGVEQAGRMGLEGFRQAGDANLARLKDQLERANISPDEVDKAYDAAFKIAADKDKGLFDSIFEKDRDAKGNLVIKSGVSPANYQLFIQKVQQGTDSILQTKFFGNKPSPPLYRDPSTNVVTDYGQKAIQQVMQDYANNPQAQREILDNPQAIQDIAEQIRQKELQSPQVGLPGARMQPVMGRPLIPSLGPRVGDYLPKNVPLPGMNVRLPTDWK